MRCWRIQGKQLKVFVLNRIFQQKAGYPPKHRTKGCVELSWLVIVYKLGGQVSHGLSSKQFMKQAMKNHWTLEGKRETCMQMHAPQTLWIYNLSRPKVLKTMYISSHYRAFMPWRNNIQLDRKFERLCHHGILVEVLSTESYFYLVFQPIRKSVGH